MQNEIDENAQLEVNISNLYATDIELVAFRTLIETGLGKNISPISINFISNNKKGKKYEIIFRVFEPTMFLQEKIQNWLYEAKLVGWNLKATFVRP